MDAGTEPIPLSALQHAVSAAAFAMAALLALLALLTLVLKTALEWRFADQLAAAHRR